MVRLSDGSRADLYLSPPNEPLLINHSNNPLFLIDAKRGRLLAMGLGMGPYGSEVFEKVGWPRDVFKTWPGVPPTWTIPYASLFAYDLSRLDFTPAGAVPTARAPAALSDRDRRLQEAVFANDLARAKRLIGEGANVNAVDADGLNTLFFAAMIDQREMVDLLIANGVDATQRDHGDWLAYHYNLLTRAATRTAGVLRDANLAQGAKKP